jgi:hypothetical protein
MRAAQRAGPLALGQRASFWVSAGVVAHTLWTSAAPAMTYRLYAEEWHMTSPDTVVVNGLTEQAPGARTVSTAMQEGCVLVF